MISLLANLIVKLILRADNNFKVKLIETLKSQEFILRKSMYCKKYNITNDLKINGRETYFHGNGQIKIGNNTYIGNYTSIQAVENCRVEIGINCAISHNVRIYTSTYVADEFTSLTLNQKIKIGNVIIGNGVWIGANVLICPNVIIGNNAVIGANSVVTKNVEANTVNSGIPSKIVRRKRIDLS